MQHSHLFDCRVNKDCLNLGPSRSDSCRWRYGSSERLLTLARWDGTFHPATVSTNLLFFEKGAPTKEIWYYEHRLPEGQKSYSKTKGIQFCEFAPMIEWWDNRQENEVAWKVKVGDLKRGFDLDVKNPNSSIEEQEHTVEGLLHLMAKRQKKIASLIADLENNLVPN